MHRRNEAVALLGNRLQEPGICRVVAERLPGSVTTLVKRSPRHTRFPTLSRILSLETTSPGMLREEYEKLGDLRSQMNRLPLLRGAGQARLNEPLAKTDVTRHEVLVVGARSTTCGQNMAGMGVCQRLATTRARAIPIVAPRATRRSRRLPSRSAPVGAGIFASHVF